MTEFPLRFPPLRSVLYDQTPLDDPILVTSTVCAPVLKIRSAVLASLQQRGKKSSIVLGRIIRNDGLEYQPPEDSVGGEWTLEMDTFDPGNNEDIPKPSETSLSVRAYRPFNIKVVTSGQVAVEDALDSWFNVKSRLRSSHATKLYGTLEPLPHDGGTRFVIESLAPSVSLIYRRIPNLVMFQNALLKKLRDGTPDTHGGLNSELEYGILTLNETRKAVLLAEDDPMAYKIPVVGVWFKNGVLIPSAPPVINELDDNERLNSMARSALRDPSIFAGCVRYACNEYLAERVCPVDSPRTFLVCIIQGEYVIFLECSISTLDGDKILDRYEAIIDYPSSKAEEEKIESPEILLTHFTLPDNVIDRIELKREIDDHLARKQFRMQWMTPVKQPNSSLLLQQIEQALNEQATARRQALGNQSQIVVPFPHDTSRLVLPSSPRTVTESDSNPIQREEAPSMMRSNLLVDFIAKQQQEILDLRRIVQRLEETVLLNGPTDNQSKANVTKEQTRESSLTPHDGDEVSVASFEFSSANLVADREGSSEEYDVSNIESKYLAIISARQRDTEAEM